MKDEKGNELKLQAAMEYMATYGWMILVVAVALVALWSLGVFNFYTFAPKAAAGGCFVSRPNGPNTTAFISLSGACTNEIPKFAASFAGSGSYITINAPGGQKSTGITVSAWVYQKTTSATNCQDAVSIYGNPTNAWILRGNGGSACATTTPTAVIYDSGAVSCHSAAAMPLNQWNYLAMTYNGVAVALFVNGVQSCSASTSGSLVTGGNVLIGSGGVGYADQFNGSISNVQIYNTSLDSNTLNEMYFAGIGGDPFFINRVIGWWQLDGDTNDYSGNNDNGVPTSNINFAGNWYNGYTAP